MEDKYSQLKIILHSFGWSPKETDVYVAILLLGKGTVSEISRKAGINRTTGYDILNSLLEKQVISVSGKEPKQEYAAESPKAISGYLKRKKEELENQIKKSEEIVPDLELLHAKQNRPRIRFYEGKEGLEHVYEDTLTSSEAIRAYATVDDMHNALPTYFPEYYKRRAAKNISIRAIVPETPTSKERQTHDSEEKEKSPLYRLINTIFHRKSTFMTTK